MAARTEALYREQPRLAECEATVVALEPGGLVLDRSVFFAAAGGQPGDTGRLTSADGGVWPVSDTVCDRRSGAHLHCCPSESLPAPGTRLLCSLDWPRRYQIMRTHTAMHLLCAAVGETVTGGNFQPLRGRIDFDMPEPADRAAIEKRLGEFTRADAAVSVRWTDQKHLDAHPELVKTMSVRPPSTTSRISLVEIAGIDLQACGGTHVERTGEVGRMRIAKIEKKGRINRRIVVELSDAG